MPDTFRYSYEDDDVYDGLDDNEIIGYEVTPEDEDDDVYVGLEANEVVGYEVDPYDNPDDDDVYGSLDTPPAPVDDRPLGEDEPFWKNLIPYAGSNRLSDESRKEIEDQFNDPRGRMHLAAQAEGVSAPLVGLAERARIASPGARAAIRAEYEDSQQEFLGDDPSFLRKVEASSALWGPIILSGVMIPQLGASRLAQALGTSQAAVATAFGAAEGAAYGFGDTADGSSGDTAFATAFGALGGYAGGKIAQRLSRNRVSKIVSAGADDVAESLDAARIAAPGEPHLASIKTAKGEHIAQLRNQAKGVDVETDEGMEALRKLAEAESGLVDFKNREHNLSWAEEVVASEGEAKRALGIMEGLDLTDIKKQDEVLGELSAAGEYLVVNGQKFDDITLKARKIVQDRIVDVFPEIVSKRSRLSQRQGFGWTQHPTDEALRARTIQRFTDEGYDELVAKIPDDDIRELAERIYKRGAHGTKAAKRTILRDYMGNPLEGAPLKRMKAKIAEAESEVARLADKHGNPASKSVSKTDRLAFYGGDLVDPGTRTLRATIDEKRGTRAFRIKQALLDTSGGIGRESLDNVQRAKGVAKRLEREAETVARKMDEEFTEWLSRSGTDVGEGHGILNEMLTGDEQFRITGKVSSFAKRVETAKKAGLPEGVIDKAVKFRDQIDNLGTVVQKEVIAPQLRQVVKQIARSMRRKGITVDGKRINIREIVESDNIYGEASEVVNPLIKVIRETSDKLSKIKHAGDDITYELLIDEAAESLGYTGATLEMVPDAASAANRARSEVIAELRRGPFNTAIKLHQMNAVIEANKGRYLSRSYEAFEAPQGVFGKIKRTAQYMTDPEAVQIQRSLMERMGRKKYSEAFSMMKNADSNLTNEAINRRIYNFVQMNDDPLAAVGAGIVDTNIKFHQLKGRSEVPDYLRALLTERTNPMDRIRYTVGNLAADIGHTKMIQELYEELLQKGILSTKSLPGARNAIMGGPASSPLSGLALALDESGNPTKLYGPRNVANLLNHTRVNNAHAVFTFLNGITHVTKTALSHPTHFRNYISAGLQTTAQGHNPVNLARGLPASTYAAYEAARGRLPAGIADTAIDDVTKKNFWRSKAMVQKAFATLEGRGGTGVGIRIGEIELFLGGDRELYQSVKSKGVAAKIKSAFSPSKNKKRMVKAYQVEDDAHKINLLVAEQIRYKKILTKAGVDPKIADDLAYDFGADVVLDSMMDYNRLPAAVQWAREFPLIGPFVSFPSEIVRNTANTYKRAAMEMNGYARSGNKGLDALTEFDRTGMHRRLDAAGLSKDQKDAFLTGMRKVGKVRASSQTGVILAAAYGIPALTEMLLFRGDDGPKPPSQDALREHLPYWSENSRPIIMSYEPGVSITYMDTSYLQPWATLTKPAIAMTYALRDPYGQGRAEGAFRAIQEVLEPFLGPELIVSESWNLAQDMMKSEGASPKQAGEAALYRMYRAFSPGSFSSIERQIRAADLPWIRERLPNKTPWGTVYKPKVEAGAQFGFRMSTIDIPGSTQWRMQDWQRAYNSSMQTVSKYKESTPFKRERALLDANMNLQRATDILMRKLDAAREMGMSEVGLRKLMSDSSIPQKYHRYLLMGMSTRVVITESR